MTMTRRTFGMGGITAALSTQTAQAASPVASEDIAGLLNAELARLARDDDFAGSVLLSRMLSHTAGFGNHQTWLPTYTGPPLLANADYFRQFVNEPLMQPPGTGFLYSNNGYAVLGMLVERLAGEPFFDHLARTIWTPLGLADTSPLRMDFAAPRMAQGYVRSLDVPGAWQSNVDPRTPVGTAFGGLYSTVGDLDRFGAMLATGGLLPPDLMREWLSPWPRDRTGAGRIISTSADVAGTFGKRRLFKTIARIKGPDEGALLIVHSGQRGRRLQPKADVQSVRCGRPALGRERPESGGQLASRFCPHPSGSSQKSWGQGRGHNRTNWKVTTL